VDFLQAIILSIVEGVTEFLPVSSTGHLILASKLLGIMQTDFVKSFEIVIQLGAIAAVAVRVIVNSNSNRQKIRNTLIAFVPTGVLGLIFYKIVKTYLLGNTAVTVAALFLGGIIIIYLEKSKFSIFNFQSRSKLSISQLRPKQSLIIGLIQAISMIPGVSRAMATIFGGVGVGLSREEATEFSFLLAIPTMAAATGLDLVKSGWSFTPSEWWLLTVGFIGAFISAWVVVRWLLGYVKSHDFTAFGIYRIILAMVFLLGTGR
jgi:undecaprenyl-diphosphatase